MILTYLLQNRLGGLFIALVAGISARLVRDFKNDSRKLEPHAPVSYKEVKGKRWNGF